MIKDNEQKVPSPFDQVWFTIERFNFVCITNPQFTSDVSTNNSVGDLLRDKIVVPLRRRDEFVQKLELNIVVDLNLLWMDMVNNLYCQDKSSLKGVLELIGSKHTLAKAFAISLVVFSAVAVFCVGPDFSRFFRSSIIGKAIININRSRVQIGYIYITINKERLFLIIFFYICFSFLLLISKEVYNDSLVCKWLLLVYLKMMRSRGGISDLNHIFV